MSGEAFLGYKKKHRARRVSLQETSSTYKNLQKRNNFLFCF